MWRLFAMDNQIMIDFLFPEDPSQLLQPLPLEVKAARLLEIWNERNPIQQGLTFLIGAEWQHLTTHPLFKERYQLYLEDRRLYHDHARHQKLFAFEVALDYLHRAVALLPEEALIVLSIEKWDQLTRAEYMQLFSPERSMHVQFSPKQLEKKEGSIGIVLPADSQIASPDHFALFQQIIDSKNNLIGLPELSIPDFWEGLDQIIAIKKFSNKHIERALLGFKAASGQITWIN